MKKIHRTAIVSHSPAQMYALVNDIRSYPQFLPWCKSSEVLSETEDEVRASLILAWKGIQKSFTTCNRLQPHRMIEVQLVEGPFHHLEGFWRFEALDHEACKIILDMEFEIAGGFLHFVLDPIFQQITNSLIDAFCQRAKELYDKK